ncbi:hypothetical protein AYI68_g5176 [Smittium mucronatum]|uniref:Uncharacterized protein n=1 Tax=Smittium mucronatum TaxID=133383 RepID=A0A1R0GV54_9FUNG|nr:hypothetical protein AYI68_g5176 [Smittium mucronatum]
MKNTSKDVLPDQNLDSKISRYSITDNIPPESPGVDLGSNSKVLTRLNDIISKKYSFSEEIGEQNQNLYTGESQVSPILSKNDSNDFPENLDNLNQNSTSVSNAILVDEFVINQPENLDSMFIDDFFDEISEDSIEQLGYRKNDPNSGFLLFFFFALSNSF